MLPRSLHPIKRFLKNLDIAGVANLFARILNPLLFQRIFRWTIGFVEDAEYAGERKRCEFVRGDLVGDVMTELVFGCAVPFLFLDNFEAAAFLWIARIEYVRKKFDALRHTFDDAEPLVVVRARDQA